MKYPEYLAERQASATNITNNVIPSNTVPTDNSVPSGQSNTVDPNQNAVTPSENTVDPNQNAVTPPANNVEPGGNTTPETNTVDPTPSGDVVTAKITIEKGDMRKLSLRLLERMVKHS